MMTRIPQSGVLDTMAAFACLNLNTVKHNLSLPVVTVDTGLNVWHVLHLVPIILTTPLHSASNCLQSTASRFSFSNSFNISKNLIQSCPSMTVVTSSETLSQTVHQLKLIVLKKGRAGKNISADCHSAEEASHLTAQSSPVQYNLNVHL